MAQNPPPTIAPHCVLPALATSALCARVAVALLVLATPVSAADQNSEFIAALRSRGWDDTAAEYLEWVETSPLTSADFGKQLPYERAVSRAAMARSTRTLAEREVALSQAAAEFAAFAKAQPASDAALDALRQAANLYAECALVILNAAEQLPEQATQQLEDRRADARKNFAEGLRAAEELVARCGAELAKLPKAAALHADDAAKARAEQLRNREVEAQFLGARLLFEQAAAFDKKSAEHSEALEAASGRFGELVETRRGSLIESFSRFYQGRCAQELGGYEKALTFYRNILSVRTSNAELRKWQARTQRRQTECLLALKEIDEAIRTSEDWLAGSSPAERQQPEWLEVAFRLADAYVAPRDDEQAEGNDRRQQAQARTLLRDVADRPNEFQQQARVRLASNGQKNGDVPDLGSFEAAFTAGKTSLELYNSSMLAAKLAQENNPEAEAELREEAVQQRQNAMRALEQALRLADRQTPADQLNSVRYFLSVLFWEDQRFFEAAVLAEHLARQDSENESAAAAAKVALASYERLAQESRAAQSDNSPTYEARKLVELSELVASRWPDSPEAASAVNVLVQTALRENRLADAEALLARLPEASRGAAELSLGSGLWTQYLRATSGQRDQPNEQNAATRDKAGALLKKGFDSARQNKRMTTSTLIGALALAQYLLAQGEANTAVGVLEDEDVGPLAAIEQKSEAASRPDVVQEIYKVALRAYLSATPPDVEKADRAMAALEKGLTNGGEADEQKLTDVYLALGVQLQRQMKELASNRQPEKAAEVAAAFGGLLDRVAKRPDADTWRIRNWLAQTNLQIGQVLGGEDAKPYVSRAKESYDAILATVAKDKNYAPDADAVLAVRMRLGECLAALGRYDQAVKQYGEILRERPNTLDLQLAAAVALQDWGVAKRDASALDRAIQGDLPQADGKKLIWGWLRLAAMADSAKRQSAAKGDATAGERAARYEDLFYQARYNVARSRYLAAAIVSGAERQRHLDAARTNILQMKKLYPRLGGEKWSTAFNDLLKQIDKELAKK